MMALYLLIVIALWVGLSWALWKLWRRWRAAEGANRRLRDALALVLGAVWLGVSFWYGGGQKYYYDLQVERLCAQDGGVKVYERVILSAEAYDRYANRNWVLPKKTQAKPEDEYYVETDRHYYRNEDPELSRVQHRIIRRSDGKVLGELVRYGRGGGDFPGPWHGSSFSCPDAAATSGFETSLFIRGDAK